MAGQGQLRSMWRQVREHNVAQAQVATRAQHRARWLAALTAVLALFSGAAWGKLAGSLFSDQTAELIAALAAFAAAGVAVVIAAMHWSDAEEMAKHMASADEWGERDSEIRLALWRVEQGETLSKEEMKALIDACAKTEREEADVSEADLKRASKWLHKNRPEVYAEGPALVPN